MRQISRLMIATGLYIGLSSIGTNGAVGMSGPIFPHQSFPAGEGARSLIAHDLNGNGVADLVVANSQLDAISVVLAIGPGVYADPVMYDVGVNPNSLAVGDVNANGVPDLVVNTGDPFGQGTIHVLLGNGDGTFDPHAQVPTGTSSGSIRLGDLNASGHLDIVVTLLAEHAVAVHLGAGDGTFGPGNTFSTGTGPIAVTIGDVTGNDIPDLVVANTGTDLLWDVGNTVSVLLGHGDGTFAPHQTYTVQAFPLAIAIDDLNGNGIPDLVVANMGAPSETGESISILYGNGDGKFAPQVILSAGGTPRDVVIADLDGSGQRDLVVANGSNITVFMSIGKGAFAPPDQYFLANGTSLAVGDLTNNDIVDIAVANPSAGIVSVMHGLGDGTFPMPESYHVSSGGHPRSIVATDLNGDGRLDLAVSLTSSSQVAVLLGQEDDTFAQPLTFNVGSGPYSVAAADLNGNGTIDLATADFAGISASVLLGNGDGTFEPAQHYPVAHNPYHIAAGDLTGNGAPDLVTANNGVWNDQGFTISLLLNDGDGTFAPQQSIVTGHRPRSTTIADLNTNGMLDLAVANNGAMSVAVLLNEGAGTFTSPQPYVVGDNPYFISSGDLNNNGVIDLVVANRQSNEVSVLLNRGDGSFGPAQHFAVGANPVGVTISDFDGDGAPDIAVINQTGGDISLLLGDGDGNFASQQTFSAEHSTGWALAAADLNNNGAQDLAVTTGSATLTILRNMTSPTDVPGDLNGDGVVNVFDLLILLSEWGPCADPSDCPADLNDDAVVDVFDLLILLANWS